MKLNGKTLVMVMVMAVGAIGATGCNNAPSDDAIAPEESVASAPVEESNEASTDSPGFEQNARRFGARASVRTSGRRYYAPHAPPASRYERRGRAPSARHFWANGYYRWNGRQHVWHGGRWEVRRERYQYESPRWTRLFGRWEYVPGRWVRRY